MSECILYGAKLPREIMGCMRVDRSFYNKADKESIDKLEKKKWTRDFYTVKKEKTGGKLLLINSHYDKIGTKSILFKILSGFFETLFRRYKS